VSTEAEEGVVTHMGAFWDIIQTELDRERFDVSDRKLASKLKVSPTTIANWRSGLNDLPEVRSLAAVAEFSGRSYEDVLLAALADTGYATGTRFEARRGTLANGTGEPLSPKRPSPRS
jgi:transcriptional regulator with XRE-family HTH domain